MTTYVDFVTRYPDGPPPELRLAIGGAVMAWQGKVGLFLRGSEAGVVLRVIDGQDTFDLHIPWEQVMLPVRS